MTMDVSYVARNVSIPDRFRDYAQEKFSKIEQLAQRAQRLEIKVTKQSNHRHSGQNLTVELTVQGKGKVIRAEAQSDDKFAAFDLAFGKLLERLRRLRDRQKDRQHQRVSVADATAALPVIDPERSLVDQVKEDQAAQEGALADQNGEAPVFLISLKAGGVGLTLTEADYVFVLDPWWNPAVEAQAVDRVHRIGQESPVMVYRLVSAGTIEEKVVELKSRKAELVASVLDEASSSSGELSADDLAGLFS